MKKKTPRDMLVTVQARLEGLSGTIRYDLPDDLRRELNDLSLYINTVTKIHPEAAVAFDLSNMYIKPMPEWILNPEIGRRADKAVKS